MLTCVCRPVSGNLPKIPPTAKPMVYHTRSNVITVVTTEPKIKVPGRLTSVELRAMALRQQQQIDSQHQLLVTKEQRLRFLKSQEVHNAVASAEGERLRRLRERVEAQESKLRRLRALRGQVDLQKTYNVALSNDLDSIRALFSEKEKELSVAVAKVDALTRQLEDLRRDRRCPLNLISGTNGTAQQLPPQATRELEKLRRELMYRNQLTLQQDARLHMQREALQQRQAELRSVDQRIYELQTRLQRKKAANIQTTSQIQSHQQQVQEQLLHPPSQQQKQQQLQQQQGRHHPPQLQQQQQKQQQRQKPQPQSFATDVTTSTGDYQSNFTKQGANALKQQLLQKQVNTTSHMQKPTMNLQQRQKFNSNIIAREQVRSAPRINVAAVEPFMHTPQKSSITSTSSYLGVNNMLKHAAATANTNQQNQLIQDLTHIKLNLVHNGSLSNKNQSFFTGNGESDESKLAKKMMTASIATTTQSTDHQKETESSGSQHIYAEVGPKKRDTAKEVKNIDIATINDNANISNSKIPKSVTTLSVSNSNKCNIPSAILLPATKDDTDQQENKKEAAVASEKLSEKNTQQLTVHSMPLGTANKSVATAVPAAQTPLSLEDHEKIVTKAKPLQHLSSGHLVIPPRKPISSVAPTSVTISISKIMPYSPKVNRVAPSVVTSGSTALFTTTTTTSSTDRPALPPKPSKHSPIEAPPSNEIASSNTSTVTTLPNKKPAVDMQSLVGLQTHNINDNLPIKAKPLTIRKQPLSEQPRLKSTTTNTKLSQGNNRKVENPTTSVYLFSEVNKCSANRESFGAEQQMIANQPPLPPPVIASSSMNKAITLINTDETDNMNYSSSEKSPDSLKRRIRPGTSNACLSSKPKLIRRVSFDPLALLLDASLEGELELVKKTATQVVNPSAANDEGITALHNAICAGHFDIVKFLVEFGCDVNAQDSDGWTPLHCAASCNNLSMVKFLVECGACLFASTLSDHETPAEKCEEDEEGFDGCSEYLYSVQEKLGILHNGEVYAVFSYEAQNNDELTFNLNDRLIILRKGDDAESEWWWAKNELGEEGYVPRNLLGLYPRVQPQTSNSND